jgi:L-threonylcarbamoyladenylate synthase
MTTELIHINPLHPEPDKIRYAADALKRGKLVVFPTETVYGIGADINNKEALSTLRRLKERQNKPFSLHIASQGDLKKLNCVVNGAAKKLIKRFWPGPLTLVLPTKSGQRGCQTSVGVRMPAHPVALALLKKAKAVVAAPSANLKAKAPAVTAQQALSDLDGFVDMILDSGKTKVGVSSTVLDLTFDTPKILREGAISKREIEKIIGEVLCHSEPPHHLRRRGSSE